MEVYVQTLIFVRVLLRPLKGKQVVEKKLLKSVSVQALRRSRRREREVFNLPSSAASLAGLLAVFDVQAGIRAIRLNA